MAKVKVGPHLTPISGTIGELTYVNLNGEQVLRRKAKPAIRSAGQNVQPQRMAQAAAYWRKLKCKPDLMALYTALPRIPSQGPYQFAVRDFCHPPVVEEIDATNYGGRAGDAIRIRALDDTAVKEVEVRILDMNGAVLEEGQAAAGDDKTNWTYVSTGNLVPGQTVTICATAKDQPGNVHTRDCLAYVK